MVVLFGSPKCAFCNQAKDFLKDNGIEYEYFDVSEDSDAREELAKGGMLAVPAFKFEGEDEIHYGYKETVKKKILDLKNKK